MLSQLIAQGYGNKEDFNCAEKILYGANQTYKLGLTKEALKLSAGFGGGMGIESVCGALTGGIMALSEVFVGDVAHKSNIKDFTREFLEAFEKEMGSLNCAELKEKYRTEELKCHVIILKAAEILDGILTREWKK